MTRRRRTHLVVALIGTLAGSAHAQDTGATHVEPLAADVTGESGLPVPAVSAVFEASEADKRLTGRVGAMIRDTWLLEAKVSTPVSESGDPVRPLSLDGLGAGSTLQLSIGYVHWYPLENVEGTSRLCAAANAKAIAELDEKIKTEGPAFACTVSSIPEDQVAAFTAASAAERDAICSQIRATAKAALIGALTKVRDELNTKKPCARSTLPPEQRAEWDRFTDDMPVVLAGKVEVGHKKYKFADADTFAPDDEKLTSVSATLAVGVVHDKTGTLSASFRYERSYEEGKSATYCMPGSVMGSLVCNQLALGEPTVATKYVASVGVQNVLSSSLGFAMRLGFEFKQRMLVAEVPFYFLKPTEGTFTGGVVLGVSHGFKDDNETDPFAAVFLGGRFDVLGIETR